MKRLALRWMLLVVAGSATTWAAAQKAPMDPELQLQAIRQAVLEAALEKPTKVSSAAWIDGQGRLQETAHFQTDAQIRGVKVLAYTEEGEQNPVAKIELQDLPWAVKVAKTAPGETCPPAPQVWRQHQTLITELAPGFKGPERYAAEALLKQAGLSWQQSSTQSGYWNTEVASAVQQQTYQRHWLGQGESWPGWQVKVELLPVRTIESRASMQSVVSWVTGHAPRRWTVRVSMAYQTSPHLSPEPIWTRQVEIDAPDADAGMHPNLWVKQNMSSLGRLFDAWIQEDLGATACEPVRFSVSRQGSQSWVMDAGAGSGLKAGDRVLIVNSSKVPGRMLEPGNSHHMAIAEVVRMGRRQSVLKPLAGLPPPGPGIWVALPL
jgi:hypothetical protein